jgi:hypothetical protein
MAMVAELGISVVMVRGLEGLGFRGFVGDEPQYVHQKKKKKKKKKKLFKDTELSTYLTEGY